MRDNDGYTEYGPSQTFTGLLWLGVLILAGLTVGLAFTAKIRADSQSDAVVRVVENMMPECPEEDSCDLDYRDGILYVIEDPHDRIECDDFDGDLRSECIDGTTGEEVVGYPVSR